MFDPLVDQGHDVGVDHAVEDSSSVSAPVDPARQMQLGQVLADPRFRPADSSHECGDVGLVARQDPEKVQPAGGAEKLEDHGGTAPATTMETLAEPNPVHVHADADLPEITRAMADDNLLVMPVLDPDDRQIGVLTIDDILEATIPPSGAAGASNVPGFREQGRIGRQCACEACSRIVRSTILEQFAAVPELRDPAHRFGATYGELRQAVLDPHRHLGERLSVLERRDGGALGGDGVSG